MGRNACHTHDNSCLHRSTVQHRTAQNSNVRGTPLVFPLIMDMPSEFTAQQHSKRPIARRMFADDDVCKNKPLSAFRPKTTCQAAYAFLTAWTARAASTVLSPT